LIAEQSDGDPAYQKALFHAWNEVGLVYLNLEDASKAYEAFLEAEKIAMLIESTLPEPTPESRLDLVQAYSKLMYMTEKLGRFAESAAWVEKILASVVEAHTLGIATESWSTVTEIREKIAELKAASEGKVPE
jgi:tetratricopeptide (TPR) repeat protein